MAKSGTGSVVALRVVRSDATELAPSKEDDQGLVAAVQAGDPNATTRLYDRTWPAVSRAVRRVLGPTDPSVEDVIQTSMVELITTLHRFRGECPLDRWAARLASHAACKYLRAKTMERRTFADLGPSLLQVPSATSVERDAICRALAHRLRQYLGAMDEAKAMAFLLHDVCGHDLREVAEITGGSIAAVQSRLVRGRRELQALISKDPELAGALTELAEVLR
jgi:RNA polymerase sigma-70 factor (ECF subfamily)